MKKWLVVLGLLGVLSMTRPAEAAVTDWPVIGQVVRVGQCVVGGAATLVTSLLKHLGAWGNEAITTVGQCAIHTTEEVTDVVVDVVSLQVPTPDVVPNE